MKIVLASALFPPDIAPPAPYVKELAKRLSKTHEVVVVAYGRFLEEVPRVRLVAVDKSSILPLRLVRYLVALWSAARKADLVYAQNGPSVEVAVAVIGIFRPTILHFGDRAAHDRAKQSAVLGWVERRASDIAKAVVEEAPLERPEILPFSPRPVAALAAYEAWWEAHLAELNKLFNHVTR